MARITSWTKEEEQYLLMNKNEPLKNTSIYLNRTVQSIKDKRRLLGLKREKIVNLRGKKFGRLIVLKETGRKRRKVTWLCQCDCGKQKIITSTHLVSGDTVSCGCYNRELLAKKNILNLQGQKIKNLLVLKQHGRTKYKQVKWLCKCDCGNETIVISNNLLNGNTESCGCKRNLNQRKGLAWENLLKKY